MADIGVVHLVWVPLGLPPLERFLASYRQHNGGQAHQLCIVFNGYKTRAELNLYQQLLESVAYQPLMIDKPQQDIASYFDATGYFEHDYLCFVNSHSELLDDDWLRKLAQYATQRDVGVAGATGCWVGTTYPFPERQYYRTYKGYLYAILKRQILNRRFAPFPNPFLRTNTFMLSRERMLGLRRNIRSRIDALGFENGRHGMTNQLLRKGCEVLVVGRDGGAYESPDWPRSRTFWQGEQENLLVADNRTRDYATGDVSLRRQLALKAWGAAADDPDRNTPGADMPCPQSL